MRTEECISSGFEKFSDITNFSLVSSPLLSYREPSTLCINCFINLFLLKASFDLQILFSLTKKNCRVSLELLKLLFRLTNLENIGRAVWSCMSWEWMRTIMECRPRILLIFAIVKLQSAEVPGSDSDTRNKNCRDKYFLENILLIVKCVNSNLYHILMEECNQ